jgi:non-specific serine/threonine protein kinase
LAGAVHFFAVGLLAQNRDEHAEPLFEEALAVFRTEGDKNWMSVALNNLGVVAWRRGDAERAVSLHEEALRLAREIGGDWQVAYTLGHLGTAVTDLRDYERAQTLFRESLILLWDLQDRRNVAWVLAGFASLLDERGMPERAARLCGAIEALLDDLDVALPPSGVTSFSRTVAAVKVALTEDAFRDAWTEGRAMTIEQGYAGALDGISIPDPGEDDPVRVGQRAIAARYALTRREQEVLFLLADGLTNHEIADILFVSPRTVMSHVQHIFEKLGVNNRRAAVVFAVEHGLV